MDAWDFHRWVYSGKLQNLFKVCLWKCKSESKSSLQVTFSIYLLAKWKFEIKTRIVAKLLSAILKPDYLW